MATSFSDLSGWAGRILENLNETGISTGRVVVWMESNLYKLNIPFGTNYVVSGEYIESGFSQAISGIYEEMYYCDYYNKKANSFLGAAGYDWVEIQGEEQGSYRKVSRNDTAKTYLTLAKDCQERMSSLIAWYINAISPIEASQVLYNNRVGASEYGLLFPPSECYGNNTVWV